MTSGVWYRASLSSDQIAAGHVRLIQRAFAEAIRDAIDRHGACLFASSRGARVDRLREDGKDAGAVHTDAVFFSPASIALVPHLIAEYGAQPCPAPDRASAALLVGADGDWDLLPRSTH